MDQLRYVEAAYRIQHQHPDGSWGLMEEEEPAMLHHTSTEHDPERGWLRGRIFRCKSCDEVMTVVPGAEGSVLAPSGTVGGSAAETAAHVVDDR
jgi:hypothetical protein